MISDDCLDLFRNYIYDTLGINYPPKKDYLLKSKLEKVIKKGYFDNCIDFYNSLKAGDKESYELLIRYITTNHTFFFREKRHFELLCEDIKKKKIKKPLIWCAGCSTGEEVYSIAIHLHEYKIFDYMLLASDIDRDVLQHFHEGIYYSKKLEYLTPDIVDKYFIRSRKQPDRYKVKSYLKKNVIIKRLNLTHDLVFEKKFNYVFCRNVMIYFDKQTRNEVLKNLITNLVDDGYLFIGHSESFVDVPYKLKSVDTSVYKKLL